MKILVFGVSKTIILCWFFLGLNISSLQAGTMVENLLNSKAYLGTSRASSLSIPHREAPTSVIGIYLGPSLLSAEYGEGQVTGDERYGDFTGKLKNQGAMLKLCSGVVTWYLASFERVYQSDGTLKPLDENGSPINVDGRITMSQREDIFGAGAHLVFSSGITIGWDFPLVADRISPKKSRFVAR